MNMKNAFLLVVAALAMACDSSPKPVVNTNASANSVGSGEPPVSIMRMHAMSALTGMAINDVMTVGTPPMTVTP